MAHPNDLDEIMVPTTEPETEWILGEPVRKVSPRRTHGILQFAMASRLHAWAAGRGTVATEWRFRITPPGERPRPLVPDVAYLSNERRAGLTGELLEVPFVAPDIVVEILSPEDRADRVASKRDTYLAAGVRLVIIVDPDARSIDAFDSGGRTTYANQSTFASLTFADLVIDVAALFAEIDD